MKKVLQINSVVNTGSTGRIVEEIGQLTISNNWDSYIAYGRNIGNSNSKLIKIGNDFNIKIHGLYTRLFDRHGFASTVATKYFIKQIEDIKPDIIHLHNIHGYYINIEILFNYLSKINVPVVWTLHDCWSFTGHCAYYSFVGCNKWETKCNKCPQKNEYPASFVFDNSKKNYYDKKKLFNSISNLTIVPVSNWLAKEVGKSFLNKHQIQVINNGVDLTVFQPRKTNLAETKYNLKGKFIILGVANIWSNRKGFSDFIELSKLLDSDEIIILVGLNKKQIHNLPTNIIGIERTESTIELAELYSLSDVFFNPTWEDNFPTTNLEALACGTPIITYNTGGSIESISEKTGYIVGQGNLQNAVKKTRIIKKQEKIFYSKACRSKAEEMYNKDERYLEYLNLYEKLINKKHA